MTYQEVLENARKRMAPRCKVCPECNGIACKGIMPGPAGKGSSRTFQRNFAWLSEHVKLEMDVTGGDQNRNMELELFGKTFAAPIFVAPMGLIPFAYTEVVSMTVARDRKAGPYHLMMGQNPIFIFTMQGGTR